MISIIIPTFNRCRQLMISLAALEQLDFPKSDFEVVIIDDGSTDHTARAVDEFIRKVSINIRYYECEHSGPAMTRNFGVEKASGDIVLFIGDDIICDKNLLYQHSLAHSKNPGHAVLGLVLWDESIKPDAFMNFLAPAGPQFHFNTITDPTNARFTHFYTANISIDKKWLAFDKFSTKFRYAAFEDIELGLRLEAKGLKVAYNKNAVAYHSHFYDPGMFYRRMISVGRSIVVFMDEYKCNKSIILKLYLVYAPFMLVPFGLRLFNVMFNILRKVNIVKKISMRAYWLFNVCYFYSVGILEGLDDRHN